MTKKEQTVILSSGDRVIVSLDEKDGFSRLLLQYPGHYDPESKEAKEGREIFGLTAIVRALTELGLDKNLDPIVKK